MQRIISEDARTKEDILTDISRVNRALDKAGEINLKQKQPEDHLRKELKSAKQVLSKELEIYEAGERAVRTSEERRQRVEINLNIDDLPPLMGDYLKALIKTTAAHPLIILSSLVSTASAVLLEKVKMQFFGTLYPNVWFASIARSGNFKTTALNKGAAYLYKLQDEAVKQINYLESDLSLIVGHGNKAEKDRMAINKQIDDIEKNTGLLQNRGTVEAFLQQLKTRTGCVFCSELGGWIKNVKGHGDSDYMQVLTELYDCPQSYTHRTKNNGVVRLSAPKFSICGVSTLNWVRANISADDVSSGFFARFLIYDIPSDDSIPPAFPAAVLGAENALVYGFGERVSKMQDMEYSLSPASRAVYEDYYNKIYKIGRGYQESGRPNNGGPGILEPFVRRWTPYLLKISMIMQPFFDPFVNHIEERSLRAAWQVIEPAIHSTAQLLEFDIGTSKHEDMGNAVVQWLIMRWKKQAQWPTMRELKASKVLSGGSKQYNDVLNTLFESGSVGLVNGQGSLKNASLLDKIYVTKY